MIDKAGTNLCVLMHARNKWKLKQRGVKPLF